MLKEIKFIAMLTSEDRYRHLHVRFKREVISFVVQYETSLEGKWLPVVRYDTEHRFAHRDMLDKKGSKRVTPVFAKDHNEALTFADYDIKSNWRIYKKAFLGGAGDESGE